MKWLRRGLILIHRYLGIPLSAVFVLWFASGIVMMYAGDMPSLTPELRLERLAPLELSSVRMTPAAAAARARLTRPPGRATLAMVLDRPAYRFDGVTVFADTGAPLGDVGPERAAVIASRFTGRPAADIHSLGTVTEADQWTLSLRRALPLHRFRVDDGDGTELYVSPRTGEVAMLTTRRSRALAWFGAIPHWLYFEALRVHQALWYDLVVWLSTLGCVLAVVGLGLGVTQFRWRRPPVPRRETPDATARPPGSLASRIPYAGWMRWHYVTGVLFGAVTLTWVFSGLLSMEPYAWTTVPNLRLPADTFTGGALELDRFPAMDPDRWARLTDGRALKEVTFLRIQGDPYYAVRVAAKTTPGRAERRHQPYSVTESVAADRLLVAADTLTVRHEAFSAASLLDRLATAAPDVPVVDATLLREYDAYYYSRGRQRPLPALRIKLGDPAETWLYVDPETSRLLANVHRWSRLERWFFNGLHSLDFAFLYQARPLWDLVMIVLSLGGLASSGIGLWIGVGRMRRASARWLGAPSPPRRVETARAGKP